MKNVCSVRKFQKNTVYIFAPTYLDFRKYFSHLLSRATARTLVKECHKCSSSCLKTESMHGDTTTKSRNVIL
ncbi:hypothetical protein PUN28_004936 [Cardiocondyla obscurior]|uniref:Uncharacterized protein n=1 Tax=Cardiocondyla obscurior TaxID=286306 RepID=A0AAW2GHU2_9HYME